MKRDWASIEGADSCGTASVSDDASWASQLSSPGEETSETGSATLEQLVRPGYHRAHFSRVALLGQGEYGEVFHEREIFTARTVASKRLSIREHKEDDDGGEEAATSTTSSGCDGGVSGKILIPPISAARELTLAARLQHPNIARVLDVYIDGDYGYIIMERDTLLAEYLRLLGLRDTDYCPLDGAVAARARVVTALARDLFSGLAYLHSMGIVHRDIKLDNLLVSTAGALRICDFSLSRFLPDPPCSSSSGAAGIRRGKSSSNSEWDRSSCSSGATAANDSSSFGSSSFGNRSDITYSAGLHSFGIGFTSSSQGEREPRGAADLTPGLGTIRYGAPEVLSRRAYGFAADVWSAGVVLAEILLGGERLFGGMTELAQLTKIDELLRDDGAERGGSCSSSSREGRLKTARSDSQSSGTASARRAGSKRRRICGPGEATGSCQRCCHYHRSSQRRSCVCARKSFLRQSIERRSVASWPVSLLDLVEAVLTRNPAQRLTAAEALRHPALLLA